MSGGLDKLKEIGAQKIHATTHLSREHAQALLHGSFENINKVQFFGFVSILEREYNVDLEELKEQGNEYYTSLQESSTDTATNVFVTPKKKRDYTIFYIIIVILIFLGVTIFSLFSSSSTTKIQDTKIQELNNSAIESAQKKIEVLDINTSVKTSSKVIKTIEKTEIKEIIKPVEKKIEKSLIVAPKSKVWMGFIDVKTHKHYQKIFKDKYTMDTTKEWIIVFGHGHLNMLVNGEVQKYAHKNNLRFHYKDGILKKISFEEFKKLNNGKKW